MHGAAIELEKEIGADLERLTKMQRDVLTAMASGELAAFHGEQSRVLGFGVYPARSGGIVIRAYQTPQWFLKGRGLIRERSRNVPGVWYEITDAGRAALNSQ